MVDRNLISKLGLSEEVLEQQVAELFTSEHKQLLDEELAKKVEALVPGTIVTGRIVTQFGNDVIVEEGLKKDERIIVEGIQKVRAGMKVSPMQESPAAAGGLPGRTRPEG